MTEEREAKGREEKRREGKRREGKGREGKGREGKGREGKGREGKGREGKGREGRKAIEKETKGPKLERNQGTKTGEKQPGQRPGKGREREPEFLHF